MPAGPEHLERKVAAILYAHIADDGATLTSPTGIPASPTARAGRRSCGKSPARGRAG